MLNKKKLISLFALDALLRLIFIVIALASDYEYGGGRERDGKTEALGFLLLAVATFITFVVDCVSFIVLNKLISRQVLRYVFRPIGAILTSILLFLLISEDYAPWDLSRMGSADMRIMIGTMVVSATASFLSIVFVKK
ncbi:hypothetical protein [Emticicia fontis]